MELKMSDIKTYDTNEVLAAAIAATRINNGYIKQGYTDSGEGKHVVANKILVREILQTNSYVTEEDRAKVEDVRRHWQGLSFVAVSRTLSDFEKSILEHVTADTVYEADNQAIGLMSYLPYGYEKDRQKRDVQEQLRMASNEPLGNTGDKVGTAITVLKSSGPYFSDTPGSTGKYLHVCINDKNQAIRFYYKEQLTGTHAILGRIKKVRDDGATQLNYVQLL